MKLKKISVIVMAMALVLIVGAIIAIITIKTHSNLPESNKLAAATPLTQKTSNPAVKVDLPELKGAKNISNAKDLIESVTEGEIGSNRVSKTPSDQSAGYFYRSFVIKFKRDMEASALNSQNIHAFIDNVPTEVNCTYNAGSRELQIDIKIDAGQGDLNTASFNVLLTKNIKTADGKSIGDDYAYSVANNK